MLTTAIVSADGTGEVRRTARAALVRYAIKHKLIRID